MFTIAKTCTAFALAALLAAPAAAQVTASSTPDLLARSREARTAEEHADMARRFRVEAESWEKKAAEAEADVKRLAAKASPAAHKWPELRMPEVKAAKRRAVEARRAAHENRELAQHHVNLAVEAQVASN